MTIDITLLIGILFGIGTFLILQGEWIRFLFGNILLSNAVNIFVLAMSRSPRGRTVPIINEQAAQAVDPLPQALILTAIVISFGLTSYLIVYLYRLISKHHTTNMEELYPASKEKELEPWL